MQKDESHQYRNWSNAEKDLHFGVFSLISMAYLLFTFYMMVTTGPHL